MTDVPTSDAPTRTTLPVVGAPIDVLTWDDALDRLRRWGESRESRYVCICNVHSVVTARQDAAFGAAVYAADMATADGAPVAWVMRRRGAPAQERINGPDLMWRYLAEAEARGHVVSFYGSTDETLARLREALARAFPRLVMGVAISPPFRALSAGEDAAFVDAINAAGTHVLFVGLGCPKQELWMQAHRGRVRAVMLGVGAAFDYHAGTLRRAPVWMQRRGLEWAYRVATEPRRLWRRYLFTNTAFLALLAREALGRTARR